MRGVTRRPQIPTLAGPSRNARHRHTKTHRHGRSRGGGLTRCLLSKVFSGNLATCSCQGRTAIAAPQ
jgi:hypothetical protein